MIVKPDFEMNYRIGLKEQPNVPQCKCNSFCR